MLTYTYERQDIIQIALTRLPGEGESAVKKAMSDLALPLHVKIQNYEKNPPLESLCLLKNLIKSKHYHSKHRDTQREVS
jgi:hypothetical protein